MSPIGVGIIGMGAWASVSHIPAIAALPSFELRGVTRSAAYPDHRALLAAPGIDLVVVATQVTKHVDPIVDALAAGKAVYSEWPLASDLPDAARLAGMPGSGRTMVGLQGRYAPEVRYAADLVADGYIGEVLGTTLVGSGMVWGAEVPKAYWYDDDAGATPLTAAALHALDALHAVLGEFDTVTAALVRGRKQATLTTDGSTIDVTAADQIALAGTLESGAAASIFYRGGTSRGDNFRWEINGTEGDLVLTADWGNMQVAQLALAGGHGTDVTVAPLTVPAAYTNDVPTELVGTPAAGVARLYAAFGRGEPVPDFRHALTRHREIDAIKRSAASGTRITVLR